MFSRTFVKSSIRIPITRNVINSPLRLSYRYQSTIPENKLNPNSLVSKYSEGPINLRFTEDHEWIAIHPDNTAFVGITKYASNSIGDVTYVELPEVGESISQGDIIGSIESVKSSNDIFAPIGGEIIGVNEQLNDDAPLVNQDPLGEGWIVQVKIDENAKVELLKDEKEYEEFLKDE